MQTYLHLLSPAMHVSVAATREQHLIQAAQLETEIDLLTHEGRAMRTAKDPDIAAKGRLQLDKAAANRALLRHHLTQATELTDYGDPEPDLAWLSRALTAAAEAGRSLHRRVLETKNPNYVRHKAA